MLMTFGDWISQLRTGACEIFIPALTIEQSNDRRFRGAGTLTWRADEYIRVKASTNREGERDSPSMIESRPYGILTPRDEFVSVTGETLEGWTVSTVQLPPLNDKGTIFSTSPHRLWDFETNRMTLTKPPSRVSSSVLYALFGPSLSDWPRPTETTVDVGDEKPSRSTIYDWLKVSCPFGIMTARKHSGRWFEVFLEMPTDTAAPPAVAIMSALGCAFSFLMGERIRAVGYETDLPHERVCCLIARSALPSKQHLQRPFNTQLFQTQVEGYLQRAISFFVTEQGDEVAGLLEVCWDTVDNDWSTRALAISACLEGLVRTAAKRPAATVCNPTETSAVGNAHPLKPKLDYIMRWVGERFEKPFSFRVEQCLRNLLSPTPTDSLYNWKKAGFMAIQEADIKAWKEVRHPLAHGKVGLPRDLTKKQRVLSHLDRVQSLINRIVLQLMSFDGYYTDYTVPHPKTEPFKPVDPKKLWSGP